MSPKVQKCGNLYLKGMSMRKAMIEAGYSEQYAESHCSDFFKNRELVAYIRKRQKEEADVALADAIMVKKKLMELANDSDKYVALNALKQLDAHNEWMAELEAKLKSLEVTQATEVTGNLQITFKEVKKE